MAFNNFKSDGETGFRNNDRDSQLNISRKEITILINNYELFNVSTIQESSFGNNLPIIRNRDLTTRVQCQNKNYWDERQTVTDSTENTSSQKIWKVKCQIKPNNELKGGITTIPKDDILAEKRSKFDICLEEVQNWSQTNVIKVLSLWSLRSCLWWNAQGIQVCSWLWHPLPPLSAWDEIMKCRNNYFFFKFRKVYWRVETFSNSTSNISLFISVSEFPPKMSIFSPI